MSVQMAATPVVDKELAARANNQLCTIVNQGTAIIGGKLYFAMGSYTFTDGNVLVRQRSLFSIPLTSPWPAHSFISDSLLEAVPIPPTSGSIDVPFDSDTGIILHTNTTMYFYEPDGVNNNGTSVWTYNAQTEKFALVTIDGGENVAYQPYQGGYASDPGTGRMFYIGGYRNSQKKRKRKRELDTGLTIGNSVAMPENVKRELAERAPTIPWMQILDASEGDDKAKWLPGSGGGPTLLYGQLNYVRYGKKGILVGFGGIDPDDHSQFADPNVGGYRPMNDIFVYDIDSQKWYTVKATGGYRETDIPDGRLNFCSGVSAAPDDSSFQITIYGGYKLSNAAPTNKVHVLILPTFQWLDVTPQNQTLGDGTGYGRQTSHCHMWDDAQMILLGGTVQGTNATNNTLVNVKGCNITHPPLLVLDTTTYEWKSQFNPKREYSVPLPVYNLTQGDWRGKNRKTSPPGGFDDTALFGIFKTVLPKRDPPKTFNASGAKSDSTPDPNSNSLPSGSGPSDGAIAGAVIGSVAVLAIIIGLLWWTRRRRSRQQEPPTIPQADVPNRFEKPELDSEQYKPELDGQEFKPELDWKDPMKMPPELLGDLTHNRPVPNGVYELESGAAGAELDSGQPGVELPARPVSTDSKDCALH
ncbi:hypothetical protein TWF696_003062 [Orbilia brochopaga]|uniref:Kelch repeat-containing protein n=1 Tax=Orbilia brochopaga TaxID=3140254 RepID=A0AAV9TYP9_9PEZI